MKSIRLVLLYFILDLMISSVISSSTSATTLTPIQARVLAIKEKTRKHQEWLRKKQEEIARKRTGGGNTLDSTEFNQSQNSFNEQKLYEKNKIYYDKYDPRHNEVYPEPDEQNFETTTIRSMTGTPLDTFTNEQNQNQKWHNSKQQFETTTQKQIRPTQSVTSASRLEKVTKPIGRIDKNITETNIKSPLEAIGSKDVDPMKNTTLATTNRESNSSSKRKFPIGYVGWGKWSKWTGCSRSCGGGVMLQHRRCITVKSNSTKPTKGCIGLYRRYQLCNEQSCPETKINFRQQQCSSFDNVLFNNIKYEWEPYIKDDAECVLNCKPIGISFFTTLNSTVIDGTLCSRPAEYYRYNYDGKAICIDGVCKALLGSGIIARTYANSGTIPCMGLICRPISGIFTKSPLINDYVHVATIPAGASNISITELKNSKNLLVLKLQNGKYAFNGEQKMSKSGSYEIAGATFDYRRIDGLVASNDKEIEGVTEWITCVGPIRDTIELMYLGTEETNPGIKYEYLLPILSNSEEDDSSSNSIESDGELQLKSRNGEDETNNNELTPGIAKPRRKRRFQWKLVGFSTCSKSCGGGYRTPTIRCVRDNPKRFFSPKRCMNQEKPVINENLLRCNTQPCPAYWRIEDWGDCRCHHGEGFREREVGCVQELATGIVIQVKNVACLEEEPSSKKRCECPKPTRRKHHHHHHNHHNNHHHNKIKDQPTTTPATEIVAPSVNVSTERPQIYPYKKSGVWLVSEWNQHCSAECGIGIEQRSIFCDRTPPQSGRCDLRFTPDTTRTCVNERPCDTGEWFTSPWSQCSGSCFNLTRSRQVLCIRSQLIVDDDECIVMEKPEILQNCTYQDVDYCKPRWHYSTWTDCSKPCDGGTQRRTVRCLELDTEENVLKESQRCRYANREPVYRSCNTHKCTEPHVEMLQNDVASCIDEFPNCHLAVKAKLCRNEFYKQNCCYSCLSDYFLDE